jgi:hypothetical protein
MRSKTETVQEFLARGGKITKLPAREDIIKEQTKQQAGGPAVILTMEEAGTYYGTPRKGAASNEAKLDKELKKLRDNFMALPESLRLKEMAKMKAKLAEQEDEEENS